MIWEGVQGEGRVPPGKPLGLPQYGCCPQAAGPGPGARVSPKPLLHLHAHHIPATA